MLYKVFPFFDFARFILGKGNDFTLFLSDPGGVTHAVFSRPFTYANISHLIFTHFTYTATQKYSPIWAPSSLERGQNSVKMLNF